MRALLGVVVVVAGACTAPTPHEDPDAAPADAPVIDAPPLSACAMHLTDPVTDAWGLQWDGAPRTATDVETAFTDCSSGNARLPMMAELVRVRAGTPFAIRGAGTPATLWSGVPAGELSQVSVDLAAGVPGLTTLAMPLAYRCVCDPAPASAFAAHCNGPPSEPCFTSDHLLVDQVDRPPARTGSAIFECAQLGGHLATPRELVESLQRGLVGSGLAVRTADRASYIASEELAWRNPIWSGVNDPSQLAYVDDSVPQPFRCAGFTTTGVPAPTPPTGTVLTLLDGMQVDTAGRGSVAWATANVVCLQNGGHFATSAELGRGIYQDLPPTSPGVTNWTSDQAGDISAVPTSPAYYVTTINWLTTNRRYPYAYDSTQPYDTLTWTPQAGPADFRCVFSATDPTVATSTPTDCVTPCTRITASASAAATWFDGNDRVALTWAGAIAQCRAIGGHLPSERDYAEAIFVGLPNGHNQQLWTTELGGNIPNESFFPSPAGYLDIYPYGMSVAGIAAPATHAYRCMWTNELR